MTGTGAGSNQRPELGMSRTTQGPEQELRGVRQPTT